MKLNVNVKLPDHVAIIMDGNGRWAKKRFLPRVVGHKKGSDNIQDIIECCAFLKIKQLTLFAFSKENWSRPKKEITALMSLLDKYLTVEVLNLHKNNIVFLVAGDKSKLSDVVLDKISKAEALTRNNKGLKLCLAIDYSGQWEIVDTINNFSFDFFSDLTIKKFNDIIENRNIPNIDLMIRTSGEFRISNFSLWQLSYAEMYFTDTLWPDFNKDELYKSISWFQLRDRRFGKV